MRLIKFLSEVGDIDVLLQIKREINGEAASEDSEAEDEEEEAEEEEVEEEKDEKEKNDDGKAVRRVESPTLWAILRR